MKKFEVRIKNNDILSYGIWNNEMLSWQIVIDWACAETLSLDEANRVCNYFNERI